MISYNKMKTRIIFLRSKGCREGYRPGKAEQEISDSHGDPSHERAQPSKPGQFYRGQSIFTHMTGIYF